MGEVGHGGLEEICFGRNGEFDVFGWEEVDGVGDMCSFGVNVVDRVATVVFEGRANIPAIVAMGGPGATLCGFVMRDDFDARGSHWSGCVVVPTVEVFVRREAGIDTCSSEEIQSEFCLREEEIPEMEGKVRIGCAETCDEVVFEGADCPFSIVAAMYAWGYQLKFGVLLMEVIFESLAAFIV